MTEELYKKHRPEKFKDVVGQPDAVSTLTALLKSKKLPHTILFSGPSGCGKTTIARILKSKLECSASDFDEKNCADFNGIDMVREIRSKMSLHPIGGKTKIYLIDECHQLTGAAQNAFLKILEDTPKHVYFFLCTTDPGKVIDTILTRCTRIQLVELGPDKLKTVIETALEKEGKELSEEVVDRIINASHGSARTALVLSHKVMELESEDDQLDAIYRSDHQEQAIELFKCLINPRCRWKEIAKVLKGLEAEAVEGLRHMLLAISTNVMLKGSANSKRAYLIISAFRDNFFDSKRAGLVAACWEVIHGE